jgi:hypothetical protein
MPIDDPVVAAPVAREILVQIGSFGRFSFGGMMFGIRLTEAAEKLLIPEMLGLSSFIETSDEGARTMTVAGQKWMLNSRPGFVEREARWPD